MTRPRACEGEKETECDTVRQRERVAPVIEHALCLTVKAKKSSGLVNPSLAVFWLHRHDLP
jgi:hypothetical protein